MDNMQERIIDAIRFERSMLDVDEKLPSLFHNCGSMLDMAIEAILKPFPQNKAIWLNDVLHPITKLKLEFIHNPNSPRDRMETILRLTDLESYICKNWRFV